jgi:hypothetical protein
LFNLASASQIGMTAPTVARSQEAALRARLGIPPDARQVLVFGETSHWDPNWLHTTEEYYGLCIPRIVERALLALEQEPRRVFSVESLFFLQRYWQSNPAEHERLRGLVNQHRGHPARLRRRTAVAQSQWHDRAAAACVPAG